MTHNLRRGDSAFQRNMYKLLVQQLRQNSQTLICELLESIYKLASEPFESIRKLNILVLSLQYSRMWLKCKQINVFSTLRSLHLENFIYIKYKFIVIYVPQIYRFFVVYFHLCCCMFRSKKMKQKTDVHKKFIVFTRFLW